LYSPDDTTLAMLHWSPLGHRRSASPQSLRRSLPATSTGGKCQFQIIFKETPKTK